MRRLRVLWLSHFVPYPPKGGCFQRSYNLIRRAGAVHDLHLVALRPKAGTHPQEELAKAGQELAKWCRSVEIVDVSGNTRGARMAIRAVRTPLTGTPLTVSIFQSPAVRALLAEKTRSAYDLVHFDTISLAQYVPQLPGFPRVLTHHGAESFMIHRRIPGEASLLRRAFFVVEWLALRRYERLWCPRFDANLVMSPLDAGLLGAIAPGARFDVVPNGVDVHFFQPTAVADTHTLIFAGRLDQYSNRDGILHFMREVWPVVKATYPDAGIRVVGHNPPASLLDIAARDRSVQVTGFVPDVRPHFEQAAVAICPVRNGGGTRIKILDNLALGMPIVTTSVGLEGIEAVPERDVLVADEPADFARQVARVFDDAGLRGTLARNARILAESVYSWDRIASGLLAVYERVARREGRPA